VRLASDALLGLASVAIVAWGATLL